MQHRRHSHAPRRVVASWLALALGVIGLTLLGSRPAAAQTTYGTLSNFDVFNDTGQECHGFEIELHGVSSQDVTYTFGSPYQRYGNPTVEDVPGGVHVRYRSPWDPARQAFTATTPRAPSVITATSGHACWTGGSGNYLTSGCEHFGVGLRRNPTSTVYRWLIADPATPGALQPAGTRVSIPAPIWNVVPPVAGGAPVVQAVLPPEPPEVHARYGDAQWVKVFKTKSPSPARLERLLTDDPNVPQDETEIEMEWKLLQAKPNGAGNDALINEDPVAAGDKSVTRRYEFYQYTGAYDPETHEVMCGGDGGCDAPLPGELGNYIGAQMAAVNLAPDVAALALVGPVLPPGEVGAVYGAPLVTGGTPPYLIDVAGGVLPAGLAVNANGTLGGTPTAASPVPVKFTVQVTDQDGGSVTGTVRVKIRAPVDVASTTLKVGKLGRAYRNRLRARGGSGPYAWAVIAGGLPPGLTLDGGTGLLTGVPTSTGAFALTAEVTDALGGTAQATLTLTVQ